MGRRRGLRSRLLQVHHSTCRKHPLRCFAESCLIRGKERRFAQNNFLCGSGWFARIEKRGVGEEFVGSYLYQVHLYRCLESNDYGRLLSGNNAYIKVKRLVCRLLIVSVNFEAKRNSCAAQLHFFAGGCHSPKLRPTSFAAVTLSDDFGGGPGNFSLQSKSRRIRSSSRRVKGRIRQWLWLCAHDHQPKHEHHFPKLQRTHPSRDDRFVLRQ